MKQLTAARGRAAPDTAKYTWSPRATIVLLIALAAGLVGFGSMAVAADVGQGDSGIHFTGETVAFTEVPVGEEPGAGDLFVIVDDLFDEDGDKVGHEMAQALATTPITFDPPAGEMLCTITISLADGQISLVGLGDVAMIFSGERYAVPIVGGSGAYSEARGEAIYRTTGEGTFELALELR